MRPHRLAWVMITGTLYWEDLNGVVMKDRPGRKYIWRILRPRLPSRWLNRLGCGCSTGPVRRWKILYYRFGCEQHLPYPGDWDEIMAEAEEGDEDE